LAALLGLLVLSPLLLAAALAIRWDTSGPILFRQLRMGRHFRPFWILKFRTMTVDAERMGPTLTVGDDPRITRAGRWLRAFKIDELPQLINVLKGDMSVVGPRPEVPEYVEFFRADYEHVLTVLPGITDLASLQFRDEADTLSEAADPRDEYVTRVLPRKIELANEYIRNSSLLLDIAIVLRTIVRVVEPLHLSRNDQLQHALLSIRRGPVVAFQLGIVAAANYSAFLLRFDSNLPDWALRSFWRALPWVVLIRALTFIPFHLYEGLWRFTSIYDLKAVISGVAASSVLVYILVQMPMGPDKYPRSIPLIDAALLMLLLGGIRFTRRMFQESAGSARITKRVLIYGAGNAAEFIVREMRRNPSQGYKPIGFIDDDLGKKGHTIHGVRVIGGRESLAVAIEVYKPDELLIAMPGAEPEVLRSVVKSVRPFKIPIKTLPPLRDIIAAEPAVGQIRNLVVEDLLVRPQVGLSAAPLERLILGRDVMVTGAGGSIGSELCRQIAKLRPKSVVLYDRYENGLFAITNDLADRGVECDVRALVGDVTDTKRLNTVMSEYCPGVIFHAAAHKHVPLMEFNACEAVKNNVLGTRLVMKCAVAHNVERFVLISTDKAVNPTSIMGATKRVAELLIQTVAQERGTAFFAVRFGTVLASNGSVVPRFVEQIKAGGPATVTHSDIRRYFMLIPEAVQLVLHAAALAQAGAVYVLDMGEQVKLVDMARNLIRLSGFVPDDEIPIVFTGLRPGEKLSEELVGNDELAEPSGIDKIIRVRRIVAATPDSLNLQIAELEQTAVQGDTAATVRQLQSIVPNFQPGPAYADPVSL
jgi:FlaA1/EpsC-like NDP-sugar epimerase/lipopolysaccharide/colanic/teichoic acid biosynthesis glycosyltransferase